MLILGELELYFIRDRRLKSICSSVIVSGKDSSGLGSIVERASTIPGLNLHAIFGVIIAGIVDAERIGPL